MRHKTKLAMKLLRSIVIFGSILVLFTFTVVAIVYVNYHSNCIRQTAFDYAKTAARYIDGDSIPRYVETLKEDGLYFKIEAFINAVRCQKYTDIKYYYVIVPCEDDYIYIWDAALSNEENPTYLGDREAYSKGDKEAVFQAFQPNPVEKLHITNDEVYGLTATAYYPILDSQGGPVAVVAVDLFYDRILTERRSVLFRLFFIILSVVTLFSIAGYCWLTRQIVLPIITIKKGMQIFRRKMDSDEATMALDNIHLTNEIGALAGGFIALMVMTETRIANAAKLSAEQEHIAAELNIATKIQADMLPCVFPAFPERKEFELFACMHPAKEVGGDFYDFFLIDDDHLALVMADVSGKGVPAALFMVITRTLIKNRALMGGTPAKILSDVNTQLCKENKSGMFVTVWMAILEISTGKGMAANAGHENPVLRRVGGSYELVKYRHCPVLAFMKGIRYEEHSFQLCPGDRLLVYTDGVPEATSAAPELYGCERMIDVLNAAGELSPRETLLDLKRSIDAFVGNAPQFDDITMLCLDYYGTAPAHPYGAQHPDQATEVLSASKKGAMEL